MTQSRKNAPTTRGKPFAPGNSGRPKGSRHRATMAAEALLDGEAEGLTRKAIEMALEGDTVAMRLCLERLVPPRKDRPLMFEMPSIASPQDHPAVLMAVIEAMAGGDLTPTEATAFAAVMEQHRRAVETSELAARIDALEQGTGRTGGNT